MFMFFICFSVVSMSAHFLSISLFSSLSVFSLSPSSNRLYFYLCSSIPMSIPLYILHLFSFLLAFSVHAWVVSSKQSQTNLAQNFSMVSLTIYLCISPCITDIILFLCLLFTSLRDDRRVWVDTGTCIRNSVGSESGF